MSLYSWDNHSSSAISALGDFTLEFLFALATVLLLPGFSIPDLDQPQVV
jgi:hypothetical protein